jgi:hypothetical protein
MQFDLKANNAEGVRLISAHGSSITMLNTLRDWQTRITA